MNKVQLVGRLTKDVELKRTQNQTTYCNFTIAVDRRFKDANGNRQADFINCVAWQKTAEFIQKYFKRGNRIGIVGAIQTRSYEKDGQKVYITEVLAEEAEFVESNGNTDNTQKKPRISGDDPVMQECVEANGYDGVDLPFEI